MKLEELGISTSLYGVYKALQANAKLNLKCMGKKSRLVKSYPQPIKKTVSYKIPTR